MAFTETFDERFGFNQAGANGGQPGDFDVGSGFVPGETLGTIAPNILAYGELTAPSFGEADIDFYQLGALAPGDYVVEFKGFDWGLRGSNGSADRSSLLVQNSAGAFVTVERNLGLSTIEFTVNQTATFAVRVEGRNGQDEQYTISFFEEGTILRNNDAIFNPVVFSVAPRAGEIVFFTPRFADPDGTRGAEAEVEYFLNGVSVGVLDSFTPGPEAVGLTVTARISFVDERGTREVSDFFDLGVVEPGFGTVDPVVPTPTPTEPPLTGDGGDNVLTGDDGNDVIAGGGGNDILRGGGGDDTLRGDQGADRLVGNAGNDRLTGGAGDDVLRGGGGSDTLVGNSGADRLIGGGGADNIRGGGAADDLRGGGGGDQMKGGGGRDVISGGGGVDRINGGGGADRLIGNRGSDELTGGGGRDVFVFTRGDGIDLITDFRQGQDRIEVLNGADAFGDLFITQVGADVVIAFANVRITIEDQNEGAFSGADFIF